MCSRVFGDEQLKRLRPELRASLAPEPAITTVQLQPGRDTHIGVASDGLRLKDYVPLERRQEGTLDELARAWAWGMSVGNDDQVLVIGEIHSG